MFGSYFQVTAISVLQVCILGAIGYLLVKINILNPCSLNALSRMVIEVTLPLLIFCQLIRRFSFSLYPDWWIYPLISAGITLLGLAVGWAFSWFIKGRRHKAQFIGLVTFQNSGYLPLALIAALLAPDKLSDMLVYLFLLLLGFNLIMFSLGVYLLTAEKESKFKAATLLNPTVIATLISLAFVYAGLSAVIPDAVLVPLKAVGDCTIPLAVFVVGASLAQIKLRHIDKKAMFWMVLAKLIVLPVLGLLLILRIRLPELIGLMILIQLAMPPATSLSVVTANYKKEDLLISQGIFIGHIVSIFTIPLFLSLYFILSVIK